MQSSSNGCIYNRSQAYEVPGAPDQAYQSSVRWSRLAAGLLFAWAGEVIYTNAVTKRKTNTQTIISLYLLDASHESRRQAGDGHTATTAIGGIRLDGHGPLCLSHRYGQTSIPTRRHGADYNNHNKAMSTT